MGFLIKLASGGVLQQKQEELEKAKEAEAAAVAAAPPAASEEEKAKAAAESREAAVNPPGEAKEAAAVNGTGTAAAADSFAGEAAGAGAEAASEEEDEEMMDDEGPKFMWDATKRELVEIGVVQRKARRKMQKEVCATKQPPEGDAAEAQAEKKDDKEAEQAAEQEDCAEEEEEEEEEGECSDDASEASEGEQVDQDSKALFLEEASTPELIKQALALGGAMAEGVTNKWVLDQVTKLYFRYDTAGQQMYCWNSEQGCLYKWQTSRKLRFVWASPTGPSAPPSALPSATPGGAPLPAMQVDTPPAGATAAKAPTTEPSQEEPAASAKAEANADAEMPASGGAKAEADSYKALWITILPPSVLTVGFLDPSEKTTEEMQLNGRALAAVIGKGGSSIKEIEKASGVKTTTRKQQQGEKSGALILEGTRGQIVAAKAAVEQRLLAALGAAAMERMQKFKDSELLAQKRTETGAEAAMKGVAGLSEFVEKWGVQAVWSRKLAKMDAMLQRHLIRHFNPQKAKPMSALRSYVAALQKYPQWWRLEALYEDGELDGEICETVIIGEAGAVIGSAPAAQEGGSEQLIELEFDVAMGEREASRLYGDVQPQHCRLLRIGSNFYVCGLESKIGTLVDGQKIRELDGPVPIRDSTLLGVGKYLLFCEVEVPAVLQNRRQRLLAGQGLPRPAKPAKATSGAGAAAGKEETAALEEKQPEESKDKEEGEEKMNAPVVVEQTPQPEPDQAEGKGEKRGADAEDRAQVSEEPAPKKTKVEEDRGEEDVKEDKEHLKEDSALANDSGAELEPGQALSSDQKPVVARTADAT